MSGVGKVLLKFACLALKTLHVKHTLNLS